MNGEHQVINQVKQLLDASEVLDPQTAMDLARRRQQALASARAATHAWWPAAGAALAATALLVVVLWRWDGATPDQDLLQQDLEIMAAAEEWEFYQDLEFYQWLLEHEGHAS